MGVRARPGLALALLLLLSAACEAVDDGPAVGTPGLEPPKMVSDAGAVELEPGSDPGASPPPVVGPGDSTGGLGTGGTTTGGAAGAGGGAGSRSTPVSELDAGVDAGPDGGSGPGDALFEGLWVIDQPSHALYEATLYELAPSGELNPLETMLLGAEPWPGYTTGTVANADGSVRCQFEGLWRSIAERVVELDSTCTDATPRRVQIELPEGQDVMTGVMPIVLPVEGDSGWEHRDWPWSWRKCESREACVPF